MISACSLSVSRGFGGGMRCDDRLEHVDDVEAGLGADRHRVLGVDADHRLDLVLDLLDVGGRQVDLVEHRHHFQALLDRGVAVGDRLRLDALRGVDHQQRAFAGGERARDFVAEVDVAGGVDEVELVGLCRRFAVYGSETDCALMVMPRSRSIGFESSTCASISRASRPPQSWMMRSASVDLPWSTWAMMEKLRMCCMRGLGRRKKRGIVAYSGMAPAAAPVPGAFAARGSLRRTGFTAFPPPDGGVTAT